MPYKNRIKQLLYMRKYQSRKGEEFRKCEEIKNVESQAIQFMRQHIIGRQLFYVGQVGDDALQTCGEICGILTIPIISASIDSPVNSETIEKAVTKIFEAEDTLLLTGEHKDWPALGIHGLATAEKRNVIKSCGNYEKDFRNAAKQLHRNGCEPPYSIISSSKHTMHAPFEVEGFYISKFLYNGNGEQNNMLVIGDSKNFEILMGWDLQLFSSHNQYHFTEALAPLIHNPKAICEIQDIRPEAFENPVNLGTVHIR
jgi:hypothetical protein